GTDQRIPIGRLLEVLEESKVMANVHNNLGIFIVKNCDINTDQQPSSIPDPTSSIKPTSSSINPSSSLSHSTLSPSSHSSSIVPITSTSEVPPTDSPEARSAAEFVTSSTLLMATLLMLF